MLLYGMGKKATNFIKRFDFGENWKNFNKKYLTEDRIKQANDAFIKFTEIQTLKELTVVDIGCGSGIHSFNFSKMNPKSLLSFDYDSKSVEATNYLRGVDKNNNWEVRQGSILDDKFLLSLPKFDLVYAWGVLHHTGNVWKALMNSCDLVSGGGHLYIALYSKNVNSKTDYWIKIKKKYNKSSRIGKIFLESKFILKDISIRAIFVLKYLLKSFLNLNFNDLFTNLTSHRYRGMNYIIDVRDWLGGWPMEFVWDNEVIEFVVNLNFRLVKIKTGEACTEFLFLKNS